MFTQFFDSYSGGSRKEDFDVIAIELAETMSIDWFERKYGHDPLNITCKCCGSDYSIYEAETLEDLPHENDLIVYKHDLEAQS